jgi:hypothetical protein
MDIPRSLVRQFIGCDNFVQATPSFEPASEQISAEFSRFSKIRFATATGSPLLPAIYSFFLQKDMAAELNCSLAALAMKREATNTSASLITRSNVGGWHSKTDLFSWSEEGPAQLLSIIQAAIKAVEAEIANDIANGSTHTKGEAQQLLACEREPCNAAESLEMHRIVEITGATIVPDPSPTACLQERRQVPMLPLAARARAVFLCCP